MPVARDTSSNRLDPVNPRVREGRAAEGSDISVAGAGVVRAGNGPRSFAGGERGKGTLPRRRPRGHSSVPQATTGFQVNGVETHELIDPALPGPGGRHHLEVVSSRAAIDCRRCAVSETTSMDSLPLFVASGPMCWISLPASAMMSATSGAGDVAPLPQETAALV